MAVGYTTYTANAVLNAIGNNTSFAVTAGYLKMHIGDPGAAGAGNPAVETDRTVVAFGTASSAAMSNDAAIDLLNVAASEDYTHWSLWDASTAGNCLWTGTMTALPVSAGNNFQIPIGDLDLSMTPAS
jgi:hypothetical protein